MFPKQTQLQKRTLAIQVQIATLSSEDGSRRAPSTDVVFAGAAFSGVMAGDGRICGLTANSTEVPTIPTNVDKSSPALLLSTKNHRTGLTRASVNETCMVDCQGTFLCKESALIQQDKMGNNIR